MLKKVNLIAFFTLLTLVIMSGCSQDNSEPRPRITSRTPDAENTVCFSLPWVDTQETPQSQNDSQLSSPLIANQMIFLSLEEFLDTHASVRQGRADDDIAHAATRLDFESINTLYFPVNIPEEYQLASIVVYEEWIRIWFIAGPVTDETWHNALANSQYFLLQITRVTYQDLEEWGHTSPLQGIMYSFNLTEDDLIDGKYIYLEVGNILIWAQGSNYLMLHMPQTSDIIAFGENITRFEGYSVYDTLQFTETIAIDLTNR